ncbi:TPA: hypothetical protein HND20_04540 [Escherichia coli]|nr:hypothetical protein [Escherichia coli]
MPWTARRCSREAWYTLAIAGLQNTKMKHSVCFINFVNYITIDCLLAILGRDFYCCTDYVVFQWH